MRQLVFIATAALLTACGGSDEPIPPPDTTELLGAPPPGMGVQYGMDATIAAGSEVELCKFVMAPPEGLLVNRDQVRYTEGSHHFLLYETAYDAIPASKDDGSAIDTSGVFDCSDGPTNGWSVTRLVGGSQNVSGDSAVDFPDDVALRVRPGAVLMLNAHYLNTTADDLDAQVRINLWTIPEEQLVHEGDILFWYNVFIEVPEMGASRAHMRCTVPEDITLTTMQSHMHARGVGYSANVVGDAPFYMNDHWENVPVMTFPEGKTIAGGSTVEYWCDYDNAEARTVYQGPRSTDEMCMLIGSYYPAQPGLGNCAADPERPWQTTSLGADWVGDGSASCAETLGCVQAGAEADDFFQHLQGCVAHSDPAVSAEMSDAVRCVLLSFSDGEDPMSACSPEITTCLSM